MSTADQITGASVFDDCKHWSMTVDEDGIGWLCIDRQGSGANVLSRDVLSEFARVVDALSSDTPTGLVIYSGKESGYIAGADINEFPRMKSGQEARELMRRTHEILARLESLSCSTVAAIDGYALGGGLELALACDWRIAVAEDRATLGFPEVQLGLHPGFGGTVRSVRLIGVSAAMPMMLTGKPVTPEKAARIGLVDRNTPRAEWRRQARELALKAPPKRSARWLDRTMRFAPLRALLARQLRATIARRAKPEHYPAPYAMVDLWREFGARTEAAYAAEARSFAKLFDSGTSRNLVRVYFLQEQLKKGAGESSAARVEHVHVVGAGIMGGDIAAWCALRGLSVTLQDRGMEYIQPALDRGHKLFEKRMSDPANLAAARERLVADLTGEGIGTADLVIEAIFEDREAKQALYRQMEARMKPGAVLATNTSSIRLEELSPSLQVPQRFVGLHFFNPVAKLPLVEVVRAESSSAEAVATALAFARQIGKIPLPCRSQPGFLVNRVLAPYMAEALEMMQEGVSIRDIDDAAVDFGMPVGPIELTDSVGVDIALHVARILAPVVGREVSPKLEELVAAGHLGQKSGRGFYEYRDGKPVRPEAGGGPRPEDIQDRLVLSLLNEAAACLADNVVAGPDLVDAGVIFGTGFAPFRGGPMHYARAVGVERIVENLEKLAEAHGPRFTPSRGWAELVQ